MTQAADFVSTLYHGEDDPNKVTVALTMVLQARRKGHSVCLILMADAVALGVPGAADSLDIGQPFQPAAQLLKDYLSEGGRVAVCKSCLIHNGFTVEQMDGRYEIINAPDVVDLLMGATGTLQVA